MYCDAVASGEKPVADEVQACHSGAEVKPVGFGEKVNSREELISDGVGGILQVCLWMSHGAIQQTLGKKVVLEVSGKMNAYTCITIH